MSDLTHPSVSAFHWFLGSIRLSYYEGIDTISADGLDDEERYRVVLWPGERTAPRVIKPYAGEFPGG